LISTSFDGIKFNIKEEIARTDEPCPKSYTVNIQETVVPSYHRLIFVNQDGDTSILKTNVMHSYQEKNCSTFYLNDKIIIKSEKNVLEWCCLNLMGEIVTNGIYFSDSNRLIEVSKESVKKGLYFVVLKTSEETEFVKIYIE
jgi:hypothetical protein